MNDDPDNIMNSKYYSINEIQSLKVTNKNQSLFMFYINACSLNKNFDDLAYLLKWTNKKFDAVAVTETRITGNTFKLCNIRLKNYSVESTPAESSAGETLLYIANHFSYKPSNVLNISKKSELGSTFVEIINPKKSNIIVAVIYRHPSMDVTDFNKNYLNGLLDKILKEEKTYFLKHTDFNISLLNYNEHRSTNDFLDSLASTSLLPYILQPTQLTSDSKALTDNIFCNLTSHKVISGNITATTSDHLPQFLIAPNVFANPSSNKFNIFERNWSNFNQENFILDYFSQKN